MLSLINFKVKTSFLDNMNLWYCVFVNLHSCLEFPKSYHRLMWCIVHELRKLQHKFWFINLRKNDNWWLGMPSNPFQCFCLENPRDGGAWWAAIYGVAQSRTRLKWLSSSSRLESRLIFSLALTLKSGSGGFYWRTAPQSQDQALGMLIAFGVSLLLAL